MSAAEVPVSSAKSLLQATAFATVVAAAVLVLAVLPSEYGIDPTGLGERMGLTELPARPGDGPVGPAPVGAAERREDRVDVTLEAGKGLEYKFHLVGGHTIAYSWQTDFGSLNFDFHGEPKGAEPGVFESWTRGRSAKMEGSLNAPFEGSHGWYWENDNEYEVVVTLETSGVYEVIGLLK